MWLVWTLIGVLAGVIVLIGIIDFLDYNERQKMWEKAQQICESTSNRFSLSQYYKDIARAFCEIQAERKREEEYEITLWWGLDGLCLHKDGTLEGVSKRKKTLGETITEANTEAMRATLDRLTYTVYYPQCVGYSPWLYSGYGGYRYMPLQWSTDQICNTQTMIDRSMRLQTQSLEAQFNALNDQISRRHNRIQH